MDLPPKVKIGTVLHAFAIQRAIEHRRKTYDFLAGTARYKLDFATALRPLMTLTARRPGLRTRAATWADRGLRSLARQVRGVVRSRSTSG
jgi:CelD/BcsL family acetyltransferase involved in cellulose biosynthesis